MPVFPVSRTEFSRELIKDMARAYAQACAALDLSASDPRKRVVASYVIEAAELGMRSQLALYVTALRKFQDSNPSDTGRA
jgi:hypothetical protein